jgi:pyruvate-formate lyase-activating enzyme
MNKVFRKGYDWTRRSRLGLALFSLFSFVRYIPMFRRRKTYCHLLWDSVYIDDYGHVFPCCHVRPGMIGDIYQSDLHDIWTKSLSLKFFRLMSSCGCLYCASGCDLLTANEKLTPITTSSMPGYPRRIWIMYGETCNLNCVMCRQNHRSRVRIDERILQKNIDWSKVDEIELQGGEILSMKGAKELYVWLTQQMHKKVNVITNGMLINDEWAENFVKGAKWILISVNAAKSKTHESINRGSSFEKVIDNIKKMIVLNRNLGTNVNIAFKYTIVPENISEIADAIVLADSIGCDMITFGYDRCVPIFLAKNSEIAQDVRHSLRSLLEPGNAKIQIDTNVLLYLRLLDHIEV